MGSIDGYVFTTDIPSCPLMVLGFNLDNMDMISFRSTGSKNKLCSCLRFR